MREKIRNRFSQSFTDQFTVDSLTNYVLEFYECFPTIFSIEELVSRNDGIGLIDSIEKFNRKQQIMTNVMFQNFNIIDVNWIKFSHSIYLDTLYLMNVGKLSKENRENYLKSTNIVYPCERIRTCLVENKNKSAQMLADLFDLSPKEYKVYASHLMGILHEHFSEYPDLVWEDTLNDPLKYPMIGKYLKLNPQSAFGKIGYSKLETNIYDVSFYIFDDDKRTIFASNGNAMIYDEDKESIIYNDEQIQVIFEFEGKNVSYRVVSKEKNDKKVEVKVHRIPSEEEDLKYFINNGEDSDGNLRQALERINGSEQLAINEKT